MQFLKTHLQRISIRYSFNTWKYRRPIQLIQSNRMGSIFIIQGILIYIYAFDHNPPHIHVRSGTDNFSITIQDRVIEGKARSKSVKIVNDFIDEHEAELMELWGRAQRGEKITKIK